MGRIMNCQMREELFLKKKLYLEENRIRKKRVVCFHNSTTFLNSVRQYFVLSCILLCLLFVIISLPAAAQLPTGTIIINNGDAYTTTADVTLSLTSDVPGVSVMLTVTPQAGTKGQKLKLPSIRKLGVWKNISQMAC